MFEFDAGKLVIIGIVALIVIGPKELPRVLRHAGQAMARLRRMAAEFQSQFMDAMHEAELSDLKEEAAKLAASARIDASFNPVAELRNEITRAIDTTGTAAIAPSAAAESGAPAVPVGGPTANSILEPGGLGALGETGAPSHDFAGLAAPGEAMVGVAAPGTPPSGEPPLARAADRDIELPHRDAPPVTRT